jgi:hypothetical protein
VDERADARPCQALSLGSIPMPRNTHSSSPTVLLRITDGAYHMHRAFNEFGPAVRSAEAYAGAGFSVAMISATGRFLMAYEPRGKRTPA